MRTGLISLRRYGLWRLRWIARMPVLIAPTPRRLYIAPYYIPLRASANLVSQKPVKIYNAIKHFKIHTATGSGMEFSVW